MGDALSVGSVRQNSDSELHIEDYEEREVSGGERHYRELEGKEFIIDFEGSQALPVCP
jgi:hypothetical protein